MEDAASADACCSAELTGRPPASTSRGCFTDACKPPLGTSRLVVVTPTHTGAVTAPAVARFQLAQRQLSRAGIAHYVVFMAGDMPSSRCPPAAGTQEAAKLRQLRSALGNATVWCVAPSTYEAVWGARFFEQLRSLPGAESYPKRSAIHGVHWSWQMCDLHAVVGALHHLRGADTTQRENPAWKMCHERIGPTKATMCKFGPRGRRLAAAARGFDYLWVVDPDIGWTGDLSAWLRAFDASDADLLTTDEPRRRPNTTGYKQQRLRNHMSDEEVWSSLLVPVRYSVRMLATLSLLVGSGRLSFCESRAASACAARRAGSAQGGWCTMGGLRQLRPDLFFPHPKFSCCNAISEDAMAEARLVEAVGDGVAGRLVHRVRPKGATLLA